MIELFTAYSLSQIIIIGILIVLAVKEVITVIDFFKNRIKNHYSDEHKEEDRTQEIINKLQELDDKICYITDRQEEIKKEIEEQNEEIKNLTDSDKDQLRSFIVKEHHYFCYHKRSIDDFSMDALEKCFQHYTQEGGNSYVHELMEDLRKLPHTV